MQRESRLQVLLVQNQEGYEEIFQTASETGNASWLDLQRGLGQVQTLVTDLPTSFVVLQRRF